MDGQMQESILTDLNEQNSDLFILSVSTVVLLANTWKQVAGPQPMRMTLTVLKTNFNDPFFVSPLPVGTIGLAAAILDPLPIQIHASVFVLTIGGAWFGLSSAGQTVTVIDIIRR